MPVACVVVKDLGDRQVKFRQMVVEPERQGEGIGRELLDGVEAMLAEEGVQRFILNARDVAREFYEKIGYETVGEPFEEVGIAHWRMEKGSTG